MEGIATGLRIKGRGTFNFCIEDDDDRSVLDDDGERASLDDDGDRASFDDDIVLLRPCDVGDAPPLPLMGDDDKPLPDFLLYRRLPPRASLRARSSFF